MNVGEKSQSVAELSGARPPRILQMPVIMKW